MLAISSEQYLKTNMDNIYQAKCPGKFNSLRLTKVTTPSKSNLKKISSWTKKKESGQEEKTAK